MNIIKDILNEDLIIETERLKIYPFKINLKTAEDLFEIYSKSTNVENYCDVFTDFREFCIHQSKKIKTFQNLDNGIIMFIIELKENSKAIGLRNIILDGAYTMNGQVEINNENLITEILISEDYWRNGIAFEASIAIFKLLKVKGVKNVLSVVDYNNTKADYLDRKLGFQIINYNQAINQFYYHKDFVIHSTNIKHSNILLKSL